MKTRKPRTERGKGSGTSKRKGGAGMQEARLGGLTKKNVILSVLGTNHRSCSMKQA